MVLPKPDSPARGPLGVRPRDGLRPTRPQHEAGTRMEPAPSLAWAIGTAPAATRAAEPPLEPPAPRSSAQGLRVEPCLSDSVEKLRPSSGVVVWPSAIRPAARNLVMRSWSSAEEAPRMPRLPSVKDTPLANGPLSLMTMGTPAKGPSAEYSRASSNTA